MEGRVSLPDVVGDAVHDQVVPLVVLHLLHLDLDLLELIADAVLVLEAALHLTYLRNDITFYSTEISKEKL